MFNLSVVQKGAVELEYDSTNQPRFKVLLQYPKVVVIRVNTSTKMFNALCVTNINQLPCFNSFDPIPALELSATSDSIYLNESVDKDVPTVITFPDFKGWERCNPLLHGKYCIEICFVRIFEDNFENIKERLNNPLKLI